MCGGDCLVKLAFSGLSPLVVENVAGDGERVRVRVRVRTPDAPARCPGCGAEASRVHDYHQRTLADLPLDGRRVLMVVRVRRLVCPTRGCRQTSAGLVKILALVHFRW